MKTVDFMTQPNQPYEVSVTANGKQHLGYAGIFGMELGYPSGDICYISLIDNQNNTRHFEIMPDTYQQIRSRYDLINLETAEYLYLWVEENSHQQIERWHLFKSTLELHQLHPIHQSSYNFESLYQLLELVESLKIIPLRMFCRQILGNVQIMQNLVSFPASKRHHHSYPGGLLDHSLECSVITGQNLNAIDDMSSSEKEVTLVAALLHDIGKTQTLGMEQHSSIGRLIDHEQLTLAVLAEPLTQLTTYWPKGAETLQYLLTWNHKMGFCKFVGGNIIKLADQLSTSTSLRRMAFDGKPNYYHSSVLKIGQQSHYLNRLT